MLDGIGNVARHDAGLAWREPEMRIVVNLRDAVVDVEPHHVWRGIGEAFVPRGLELKRPEGYVGRGIAERLELAGEGGIRIVVSTLRDEGVDLYGVRDEARDEERHCGVGDADGAA